jgi:hypothetical protein
VEFAIILTLIAVVAIGGALFMGGKIKGVLSPVGATVGAGGGGAGAASSYTDKIACEKATFTWWTAGSADNNTNHGTCSNLGPQGSASAWTPAHGSADDSSAGGASKVGCLAHFYEWQLDSGHWKCD